MSGALLAVMQEKRDALLAAANDYSHRIDQVTGEVLPNHEAEEAICRAADAYAKARWAAVTGKSARRPSAKSTVQIPFGREKGRSISDASTSGLKWVLDRVNESIDDPAKDRFREKNVELRDAVEAELESR